MTTKEYIIFTGSNGFIATNLIKNYPFKKSHRYIFVYRNNKPKLYLKNIDYKLLKIDLRDISNFKKLPSKGVKIFYHFAANPDTFISLSQFNNQFYDNTKMIMNICKYCSKANVKNLFFSSSVYVYSGSKYKEFYENQETYPQEILGSSKLSSELILNSWNAHIKTKILIMRFFTIYGPGANPNQFIPKSIKKINKAKKNVNFINNEICRDFIHIDDVVNILILLTKNLPKIKDKLSIFNVGNGKKIKITFIIKSLVHLINPKLNLKLINSNKQIQGDHSHCANIDKIKKLGYRQSISIRSGLKSLINENSHQ